MSEPEKTTAAKDESSPDPQIEMTPEPLAANAQVERYLKRKAEVTEKDHREFQVYLEEKARQVAPVAPPPPRKKITLSRRNALKVVAGTAVAGEAAALGYSLTGGSASKSAGTGTGYGAQKQGIVREMTDSAADIGGRSLGRWVALLPTKMGGGTYALDLHSNRVLSSIWYWNYGDYNPISHHLCAFPSADPYRSFEFVNSTQGGRNCLIYDIRPGIPNPAPGFNIYRVRYDGARMDADGKRLRKDRPRSRRPCHHQSRGRPVLFRDRWAEGHRGLFRAPELARYLGAEVRLGRQFHKPLGVLAKGRDAHDIQDLSRPDHRVCSTIAAPRARRSNGKWCPWGSTSSRKTRFPANSPHTLSGADGTIWHPEGRWAATVVRLCGGIAILDRDRNFDPVAFLQFNKDAPGQYPVTQIDEDHWQVTFDKIASPGHEIGFSPDGKFLCMMNNLRENNCSIFDSSDPDPTKWKKIAHVEDPLWGGKYPNPFHMVFSIDGSKLYLSVLHPAPSASGVMVVDTKTWTIKKEIQGIGPDLQTPAITYDGKYVLVPFSGFQRLSSGIAVIDAETDELMGILPSNGGHHDCVIIPTKMEHMKHTRSCTL